MNYNLTIEFGRSSKLWVLYRTREYQTYTTKKEALRAIKAWMKEEEKKNA